MLKHFHVPEEIAVHVMEPALRSTTEAIFMKCGVPKDQAQLGADVLIYADLLGVDTHGVSNMLRAYVQGYNNKTLNPAPVWKIVKETPTTAVIDGDRGLGLMITPKAMEVCIEKARKYGTSVVVIRNSGHLGAAGYHAVMAAKQNMIGWCMTGGGNSLVPTFGAEPKLGTNPIAVAVPAGRQPMFIFDAAMTTIAGNKIGLARRNGKKLLPGWVAKDDGTPDMEGGAAPEFAAGSVRMQLPLGSTRELGSHKGYSLAAIVDILCGQLSFAPGFATLANNRRGHFVAAYDIAAFGEVDEFKANMDGMLDGFQKTKPAPGHDRVIYAGVSEHETEIERRKNGIPLHPEVVDWFKGICAEFSIPWRLTAK